MQQKNVAMQQNKCTVATVYKRRASPLAGKHPDGSENGKQEYALGCLLCASSTGV